MEDLHSRLSVRTSSADDIPHLSLWLLDPDILCWFPMCDVREIEDAVRIWIGYSRIDAAISVDLDGKPCAMANLYIQPYQKLKHTCLLSIIVREEMRGKGVGKFALEHLQKRAKEKFQIEILHLEVYEGNPAIHLYERMGFERYGQQTHFIKENGKYRGKILMQKYL